MEEGRWFPLARSPPDSPRQWARRHPLAARLGLSVLHGLGDFEACHEVARAVLAFRPNTRPGPSTTPPLKQKQAMPIPALYYTSSIAIAAATFLAF